MVELVLIGPLVQSYIVYSAILALKLLLLSPMTAVARVTRGVFANPEDAKALERKVKFGDSVVERIRRAHLNDLENIPVFWILGALYITTKPATAWAVLLFRVFTAARVLHTLVYALYPVPQPARAIAFGVAMVVNVYMAFQVVLYYVTAL